MKKLFAILVMALMTLGSNAQDKAYEPYFYFEGDDLVMYSDTEGASIYYSLAPFSSDVEADSLVEHMEVSTASNLYSSPIPVTNNVVIKAIAVSPNLQNSDVSVLTYNYAAWQELRKAIEYGTDVLNRAENNPDVDDDLKDQLRWMLEEGDHFYQERGMMDSFEAEHFTQRILEIAREIEAIIGTGPTAEPYAVLSDNNTVLTFYYDDQKAARNGMSVGPFEDTQDGINSGWYEQRESITNVVFDASFADCTTLTSTAYWFYGLKNLTTITGISNLNTQNVTNMSHMFFVCSSLTSLDVSRFKTDNVTDMESMFYECSSLTSLDLSSFNTANVTNMSMMFQDCHALQELNISSFNTSKVTSFFQTFLDCYNLRSLDVSSFNTENVRGMRWMFGGCSGLTSLDLSNFNTTNVTSMGEMFNGCSSLTSLDVSNFNTSNVTTMWFMFGRCSGLTSLDLSNFNTENAKYMQNMFDGCTNLVSLNISNFNTGKVEEIQDMFASCRSLASIQAGSANIPAEEYANIANPNLLVYVNEPSQAPQGVQNVVINGQAKEIILTDVTEGNNNWYCPQAFTAERISYAREFKQQTEVGISRGWESIALPFKVQTFTHETQGQIIPFAAQGNNKRFWLRGYSENGLYSASAIEANTPYLISMPNNTVVYPEEYNLNGRVTFSASNTTVPATPALDSMIIIRGDIVMMPNFQYIPKNEYTYAVNVGQARDRYAEGSVFARDYRDLRPFEAYTTHAETNGARPNNIRIAAQPKNETTGIKDIESNSAEGIWYSLDGRKLSGEPKTKGVYIQNGKKTVIR